MVWTMAISPGGESPLKACSRARTALLAEGWQISREDPGMMLIFVGDFQKPLVADFVATVELVLETGPIVQSSWVPEDQPFSGRCRREFGVRHHQRRISSRHLRCTAKPISRSTSRRFDAAGCPCRHHRRHTTEDAARVLVDAVNQYGVPFAAEHATVDTMLRFVSEGGQTPATTCSRPLHPTLLRCDRSLIQSEGRARVYRAGPRTPTKQFGLFADRLTARLR